MSPVAVESGAVQESSSRASATNKPPTQPGRGSTHSLHRGSAHSFRRGSAHSFHRGSAHRLRPQPLKGLLPHPPPGWLEPPPGPGGSLPVVFLHLRCGASMEATVARSRQPAPGGPLTRGALSPGTRGPPPLTHTPASSHHKDIPAHTHTPPTVPPPVKVSDQISNIDFPYGFCPSQTCQTEPSANVKNEADLWWGVGWSGVGESRLFQTRQSSSHFTHPPLWMEPDTQHTHTLPAGRSV